jgi:hypothetical protein
MRISFELQQSSIKTENGHHRHQKRKKKNTGSHITDIKNVPETIE